MYHNRNYIKPQRMAQPGLVRHRKTIVAIPACNEADRIGACLKALSRQTAPIDMVVLFVNNSSDETEALARRLRPHLSYDLDVIVRDLPPALASAGQARAIAMALAADRINEHGVLLTTDADSVVPTNWIALNHRALSAGVEAVCGRAILDEREAACLPPALREDEAVEARFIAMLDTIAWLLDPEPHDPAPRHTEASGASIAVTAEAFNRAGGIPPIGDGEDRAFIRNLWLMDERVRHDPGIVVTVSGRLEGRAAAGMAATLRRRMLKQDEFADPQAEPAMDAARRYGLRHRLRLAWSGIYTGRTLQRDLAVTPAVLADALAKPSFGAAWAAVEAASLVLQRARVRFADLAFETSVAQTLLRRLSVPEVLAAD